MHYASESENVPPVDFTFDTSDTTWGYGVGAGEGEAARYQTFTAPASAKMTSAEVFCFPRQSGSSLREPDREAVRHQ